MPIEIKELHIKAVVSDRKSAATSPWFTAHEKEKMKKEMVKACVHEVLQVLNDKKER
jgi:hypothetical protein